jgi:hypothetical protein
MNKQIIVLTIPGIGTKKPGYSEELENDIIKFSKNTSLAGNFRIIESIPFGATEIDLNQKDLFQRLDAANNLGGVLSLRKFVMQAFGDGVTFERNASDPDGPYHRVHRFLRSKIEEVNQIMLAYDKAILVVAAASMGAHLLSTYIWDADHNRGIFEGSPSTDKNNLRNLRHLATADCNIPLFISGLNESQVKAFDRRNQDFTWDNYYDKDDVLGWPLRQLSPSFDAMVVDHEINTGLYVGAHVRYWKDPDFTKPFAKKLVELFESME